MTKTKAVVVMAWLMATIAIGAVNAALPVGTVLHAETGPGQRITLQNGVVTQVVRLPGLDIGTWQVWGAATVQDTVTQGVHGEYLYTYSAVNRDPTHIPPEGLQSLDARPYNSGYLDANGYWHPNLYWWFAADPPPRVFHIINGDPVVFLIVESYGQVAPSLSQAFGSIIALKVSNN